MWLIYYEPWTHHSTLTTLRTDTIVDHHIHRSHDEDLRPGLPTADNVHLRQRQTPHFRLESIGPSHRLLAHMALLIDVRGPSPCSITHFVILFEARTFSASWS
ncbi:hypothetical protein D0864_11423 [Hortaea werneckii]|uniref:Uncharacterized protein n=1 Tax=Hortaea werneckii TaxID=91943 RepID=A0A3M7DUT9_HORWE|nr:hypothetical protein D0864_11423 [Hortaea werneckii]